VKRFKYLARGVRPGSRLVQWPAILASALVFLLLVITSSASALPLPVTVATPTDLTAEAVSSSEIDLTWTDNSMNETAYSIERRTGSGSFAQIDTVSPDTETYSDTGLEDGTTYYYRVRGLGNDAQIHTSSYSNVANATTDTIIPPLPIWLTAPTDLTATAESNSEINLIWNDNTNNEIDYSIERKTGSGSFAEIDTVPHNTESYSDTGLTAGTTYSYRVKAEGNGANIHDSGYSNVDSATTTAVVVPQTVLRYYIGRADYFVNDQVRTMDTVPITPFGRTLLPITYVATPLGAVVTWNGIEEKVTITLAGTTIEMWIGQNTARVNGVMEMIDPDNPAVVAITVPPGRTMLPLRFIAEKLNSQVDWDDAQQMVTVTYPKI